MQYGAKVENGEQKRGRNPDKQPSDKEKQKQKSVSLLCTIAVPVDRST